MSAETCERCKGVVCTTHTLQSGKEGRTINPIADPDGIERLMTVGITECRVNQAIDLQLPETEVRQQQLALFRGLGMAIIYAIHTEK